MLIFSPSLIISADLGKYIVSLQKLFSFNWHWIKYWGKGILFHKTKTANSSCSNGLFTQQEENFAKAIKHPLLMFINYHGIDWEWNWLKFSKCKNESVLFSFFILSKMQNLNKQKQLQKTKLFFPSDHLLLCDTWKLISIIKLQILYFAYKIQISCIFSHKLH